jgi:cytochrome c-type biogenesis protein CcmH/NrfG
MNSDNTQVIADAIIKAARLLSTGDNSEMGGAEAQAFMISRSLDDIAEAINNLAEAVREQAK